MRDDIQMSSGCTLLLQAVCTAADAQWQEGRDVLIMVMQHSKNLGATATLVSAQIALARHMQQAAINIFRKLSIASDLREHVPPDSPLPPAQFPQL